MEAAINSILRQLQGASEQVQLIIVVGVGIFFVFTIRFLGRWNDRRVNEKYFKEWLKRTSSDMDAHKCGISLLRCKRCGVGDAHVNDECKKNHPEQVDRVYYSWERYCSIFGHDNKRDVVINKREEAGWVFDLEIITDKCQKCEKIKVSETIKNKRTLSSIKAYENWLSFTDSDVNNGWAYATVERCRLHGVGKKYCIELCRRNHPEQIDLVRYSKEKYCQIFGHTYEKPIPDREDYGCRRGRVTKYRGSKICRHCGHKKFVIIYHEEALDGGETLAVCMLSPLILVFGLVGCVSSGLSHHARTYTIDR